MNRNHSLALVMPYLCILGLVVFGIFVSRSKSTDPATQAKLEERLARVEKALENVGAVLRQLDSRVGDNDRRMKYFFQNETAPAAEARAEKEGSASEEEIPPASLKSEKISKLAGTVPAFMSQQQLAKMKRIQELEKIIKGDGPDIDITFGRVTPEGNDFSVTAEDDKQLIADSYNGCMDLFSDGMRHVFAELIHDMEKLRGEEFTPEEMREIYTQTYDTRASIYEKLMPVAFQIYEAAARRIRDKPEGEFSFVPWEIKGDGKRSLDYSRSVPPYKRLPGFDKKTMMMEKGAYIVQVHQDEARFFASEMKALGELKDELRKVTRTAMKQVTGY